jgi:hypothetical protein
MSYAADLVTRYENGWPPPEQGAFSYVSETAPFGSPGRRRRYIDPTEEDGFWDR